MTVALQRDRRGTEWRNEDMLRLLKRARQNLDELEIAVKYGIDVDEKAADAANSVLFVWDVWYRRLT
jgi:hypothetical protein